MRVVDARDAAAAPAHRDVLRVRVALSSWSWWDPSTCDLFHADRPAWDPLTLKQKGQKDITSFFKPGATVTAARR